MKIFSRNTLLVSISFLLLAVLVFTLTPFTPAALSQAPDHPVATSPHLVASATPHPEYLWYETENMRGFTTDKRGEPILNPGWLNLPKAKAPGWGINGPGVSAEWTQGGESEWNSAAASSDETRATIYQDIEVPRAGDYKVWVRYADWARRTENFTIRITQGTDGEMGGGGDGETGRRGDGAKSGANIRPSVAFQHEFGAKDIIDPHDEVSMYWGWAFVWDGAQAKLQKGPARISIEVEKPAGARRHVDCVLVTNDTAYAPSGRSKPDFAAMRYLREWAQGKTPRAQLSPLIQTGSTSLVRLVTDAWQRPKIAGRDFLMPWNIAKEFWPLYEKPEAERPLYPFHAEPIEQFVEKYKGARDVPIFASKLVVPVVYIQNLPEYLKEGSPFLRYLRETRAPFAVLINYGAAQFPEGEGAAAWKLLTGELRDQFLGWVSGESVGYVWDSAATDLKVSATMSRQELLEKYRVFYTNALDKKWSSMFQTQTGPMWDKLIPAQSTSSTSFAHALAEWGVRLLGMETAAVQPMFAMRIAFTRGAARQFGGAFAYYHAPNFGDTATTFTQQQNFAGPNNFFHSRYGATMGPSLSWYRKSYYLYYMSGASAIYLEQGFDQFFKPGPGEHPFQLNPLGRITDEFMRFAESHPDRGTPYTPIAFLLDPAHGWDMTDYPQWPFGVSQINRSDRALRELFGVAYHPGLVVEGEPATADRQAFVNGVFGDIFDVIVASSASQGGVSSSEFRVSSQVPSQVQSPKTKDQSPPTTGIAGVSPAMSVVDANIRTASGRGRMKTQREATCEACYDITVPLNTEPGAAATGSLSPRKLLSFSGLPGRCRSRFCIECSPCSHLESSPALSIIEFLHSLGSQWVSAVDSQRHSKAFNQPASSGRQTITPGVSPGYTAINESQSPARGDRKPPSNPLESYRTVVVGGHIEWTPVSTGSGSDRVRPGIDWPQRLTDFVRNGGTVVLNAAQIKGLPEQLLGIRLTNTTAEADNAKCLREPDQDLSGQMFRYEKIELKGASTLVATASGDSLVTVNKVGKGSVVFSALADLLGIDGRVTPFAAHMLAHVFADATPVKVRGDVEYLINRTNTGWVVTLFNNKGVYKPQQGLAQVDRGAVVTAAITIPGQSLRTASEWITDHPLEVKRQSAGHDSVTIDIAPGGIAVVELK